MFEPRIKIRRDLYEKVQVEAERRGYSTVEEFIEHLLERAVTDAGAKPPDAEIIEEQLKGLGYLD